MFKVVFLAEGGKNRGYGHLARCKTLFDEFVKSGHDARIIVRGDKTVSAMLEAGTYTVSDWMKRPVPVCDILIIDAYSPDCDDCNRLAARAGLAVFFDDVNRIAYPPGVVINGAVIAKKIKYPGTRGVRYLTGPRYQLIRPEFLGADVKKKTSPHKSVIVTFGGNDLRGMTPVVLKTLAEKFPGLKKNVIIGNSYDSKLKLAAYADENTAFIRAPAVKEWARLMRQADFAVCAGGQTLFELAASGTPAVVIGIADNQKENIKGWLAAGFIAFAGWYDSPNLGAGLVKSVRRVVLPGQPDKMRRKASGLINPGAARGLVREITENFRKARR